MDLPRAGEVEMPLYDVRGRRAVVLPDDAVDAAARENGFVQVRYGIDTSVQSAMKPTQPEHWLRGPVPGVPTALQPVAHALLQALEDVDLHADELSSEKLRDRPGGAASIGFHLRHMAGSLDRLLTYARGEELSPDQRAALTAEKEGAPDASRDELVDGLRQVVEAAVMQLRAVRDEELDEFRGVGRAQLPSSVRGLLYHAGEHTARHAGQVITTLTVLGR